MLITLVALRIEANSLELIVENMRSFANRHTIPIKPLTLLVGENSSGKSTLLACFSIVRGNGFPFRPRFNDPPYALGNYDTMATYKGGKFGRAKSFSLGYQQSGRSGNSITDLIATYISNQGAVDLSSIVVKDNETEMHVDFLMTGQSPSIHISGMWDGKQVESVSFFFDEYARHGLPKADFEQLFDAAFYSSTFQQQHKDIEALGKIRMLFGQIDNRQALSIAPIRTKPRRTYDEITDDFSPEGEHVPFVLSRLLADAGYRETIERFGVESGLYVGLDVKRLGKNVSDPTQVLVKTSGRAANLIDVGYGVSQVLPVVVQSILTSRQSLLLLQQPEVHLHPRAQAALGSLFVDLIIDGGKQFVIETHSDYIIDRVRMEVGRGRIAPNNVCILYFEKCGIETQVHPLTLNRSGDIVNAPPSYRAFFLEEEMNLFSRTDG